MDAINLARRAVDIAKHKGAYQAEAFILDGKSLTIEVDHSQVETLKLAEENGIGIRAITANGQIGFAYSSDLRPAEIERTVQAAIVNAQKTHPDPYNTLPVSPHSIPQLRTRDEQLRNISIDDKINMAKKLEETANKADPRIKRTERAIYEDGEGEVTIVNSHGLAVTYNSGYCGLYSAVLSEEGGDTQSGHGMQYSRDYHLLDPVAVGQEAAQDAIRLLGAKSVATQRAALVLNPYIASSFLSVLAPALAADSVQKGKSLFKEKVRGKVASTLITIIDDGQLDGGIASAPVDSEGTPTNRTILIENGILQGFLHNTYTAGKDGVVSTGNGMRSTFKSTPEVGITNFFIKPGTISEAALISEIKNGLYVTSVMGMHTANPVSGDFSVGAAGVWIENGKMTHAVRGIAIAGNLLELLNGIDAVADNLRFFIGQGAPSLRIQGMSISGS